MALKPIIDFFPILNPRPAQIVALQFMQKSVDEGYRHIAMSLPTGTGKTYLGAALCFWATQFKSEKYFPGGYYWVTQKLLQDQIHSDFPKFTTGLASHLLKSASEYECPYVDTCAEGMVQMGDKPVCSLAASKKELLCVYKQNRRDFLQASLACTNYAFSFTEKLNSNKFPPREVVICDEAHLIEGTILRFIELTLNDKILYETTPQIKNLPPLRTLRKFTDWIRAYYLPILERQYNDLADRVDRDPSLRKELTGLETLLNKIVTALTAIDDTPGNWVYSQQSNNKDQLESSAKPISAVPFFTPLIRDMGHIRLYMSAYLGSKDIFCRSLGINPEKMAWLEMDSPFAPENRQIVSIPTGSMSMQNVESTLPGFLRITQKIMEKHANERGVIHCATYKLGKIIFDHFSNTKFGSRLIFPTDADQREAAFQQHAQMKNSILVSPSMMEGFDFKDDLARWQIIAKCPYKSVVDPQINAKIDKDPDWYDLDVISSLIQATGRAVRHQNDYATSYITDSDFERLFKKREYLFPTWWKNALLRPN